MGGLGALAGMGPAAGRQGGARSAQGQACTTPDTLAAAQREDGRHVQEQEAAPRRLCRHWTRGRGLTMGWQLGGGFRGQQGGGNGRRGG